MNLDSKQIYKKLQEINSDVKKDLKKHGLVAPIKLKNGNIGVGSYTIIKINGFYEIRNCNNELILSGINLPQSAAILANNLAIKHVVDNKTFTNDQMYGHAVFEELLHKKLILKKIQRKLWDSVDITKNKGTISKLKKEYYKNEINQGFEKLIRFR